MYVCTFDYEHTQTRRAHVTMALKLLVVDDSRSFVGLYDLPGGLDTTVEDVYRMTGVDPETKGFVPMFRGYAARGAPARIGSHGYRILSRTAKAETGRQVAGSPPPQKKRVVIIGSPRATPDDSQDDRAGRVITQTFVSLTTLRDVGVNVDQDVCDALVLIVKGRSETVCFYNTKTRRAETKTKEVTVASEPSDGWERGMNRWEKMGHPARVPVRLSIRNVAEKNRVSISGMVTLKVPVPEEAVGDDGNVNMSVLQDVARTLVTARLSEWALPFECLVADGGDVMGKREFVPLNDLLSGTRVIVNGVTTPGPSRVTCTLPDGSRSIVSLDTSSDCVRVLQDILMIQESVTPKVTRLIGPYGVLGTEDAVLDTVGVHHETVVTVSLRLRGEVLDCTSGRSDTGALAAIET